MHYSPRAIATRRAILGAATTCFAERGLAAATTREIAAHAGVTQPLIHHYFGSKDALFDAVVEAAADAYYDAQAEQWDLPMGDMRFFTNGLVVLFRWLGEHPDLMRLAAWARLEGRSHQASRALDVYGHVRDRLLYARDAGLLRRPVDVDIVMVLIEALFKGYWDRREVIAGYPFSSENLDERYLEHSVRVLLRGLLTPEAAAEALGSSDG